MLCGYDPLGEVLNVGHFDVKHCHVYYPHTVYYAACKFTTLVNDTVRQLT